MHVGDTSHQFGGGALRKHEDTGKQGTTSGDEGAEGPAARGESPGRHSGREEGVHAGQVSVHPRPVYGTRPLALALALPRLRDDPRRRAQVTRFVDKNK